LQNFDRIIGFWEKRQFFRRKLAKNAENCDHNIDPWSPCSRQGSGLSPKFGLRLLLHKPKARAQMGLGLGLGPWAQARAYLVKAQAWPKPEPKVYSPSPAQARSFLAWPSPRQGSGNSC
jgi:hypothetical protein